MKPVRSAATTGSKGTKGHVVCHSNAISQQVSHGDLSLIFSRLAEIEDKRTDEQFFSELVGEIYSKTEGSADRAAIVGKFEADFAAFYESLNDKSIDEKMVSIRELFNNKKNAIVSSRELLNASLASCRLAHRERDLATAERLRLQQETESFITSSAEKTAECRELQGRSKDIDILCQQRRIEEQEKTNELKEKCEESVGKVLQQIGEEERSLREKQVATMDLQGRIERLKEQLRHRKETLARNRRAIELKNQLVLARQAQYASYEDKRRTKIATYQHHLSQLAEDEIQLLKATASREVELGMYTESMQESTPMFKHFTEQVDAVEDQLRRRQEENDAIAETLSAKKKKLERLESLTSALELKLANEINDQSLELRSKELQLRRAHLAREIKDLVSALTVVVVDAEDGADGVSPPPEDPSEYSIATNENDSPISCPPSSSSRNSREGGFAIASGTRVGAETPISSPRSSSTPKRVGDSEYF